LIISSWVFWETKYLDFALIEEVIKPNILVLEIKLQIGEPTFAKIEGVGK
jgi:hypothetical protein